MAHLYNNDLVLAVTTAPNFDFVADDSDPSPTRVTIAFQPVVSTGFDGSIVRHICSQTQYALRVAYTGSGTTVLYLAWNDTDGTYFAKESTTGIDVTLFTVHDENIELGDTLDATLDSDTLTARLENSTEYKAVGYTASLTSPLSSCTSCGGCADGEHCDTSTGLCADDNKFWKQWMTWTVVGVLGALLIVVILLYVFKRMSKKRKTLVPTSVQRISIV